MKSIKFKVQGTTSLMLNDVKSANPLNEYAIEMKKYSSKRKKTEEDHMQLFKLQFISALYYDKKNGYYIKSECFEKSLEEAAKTKKLGKKFNQCVRVFDNPPLEFIDKDKTPEQLFELPSYADVRMVGIMGKSKIPTCRPIFEDWSTVVEVFYDEDLLNEQEVIECMNLAGKYHGVGTYRRLFGKFSAEVTK